MSKTVIPLGDEIVQELTDGSSGNYTITAPIDKLDQNAYLDNINMRGQRIYSPIDVTGFEKGWYEVVEDTLDDAPHINKWEKVVEGSSVSIDDKTIKEDSTSKELKVNLDNDTLVYNATKGNIEVQYNNDTFTTNGDGLRLTGVLPTIESGTNIQFGKTSDGKWGYKVGADAVVPFKTGVITMGMWSEGLNWQGSAKDITGNIIILTPCIGTPNAEPQYELVNNTGEDIYRCNTNMYKFIIEKDKRTTFGGNLGGIFICEDMSKKVKLNIKDVACTTNRLLWVLNLE